jgi:hypothetical protein
LPVLALYLAQAVEQTCDHARLTCRVDTMRPSNREQQLPMRFATELFNACLIALLKSRSSAGGPPMQKTFSLNCVAIAIGIVVLALAPCIALAGKKKAPSGPSESLGLNYTKPQQSYTTQKQEQNLKNKNQLRNLQKQSE